MGNYPSINGRDFPNEVQNSLKIMIAESSYFAYIDD